MPGAQVMGPESAGQQHWKIIQNAVEPAREQIRSADPVIQGAAISPHPAGLVVGIDLQQQHPIGCAPLRAAPPWGRRTPRRCAGQCRWRPAGSPAASSSGPGPASQTSGAGPLYHRGTAPHRAGHGAEGSRRRWRDRVPRWRARLGPGSSSPAPALAGAVRRLVRRPGRLPGPPRRKVPRSPSSTGDQPGRTPSPVGRRLRRRTPATCPVAAPGTRAARGSRWC